MKRLLFFLFIAVSAFGQSRYVTSVSPDSSTFFLLDDGSIPMANDFDFGGFKGTNAADPASAQDVATLHWVTNWVATHAGSMTDWSTNPAVSDVDMAGYKLVDNGGNTYLLLNDPITGQIKLHDDSGNGIEIISSGGGIDVTASSINVNNTGFDGFFSATSLSTLSSVSLADDANFGIHNGEPAGVGSDINLTSANGQVIINAPNNAGTFPFETGNGTMLSLTSSVSHATIWSGYVSGDRGTLDFVPEADVHTNIGLRIAVHSIYGTDDSLFQALPSSTGYGALEGVGGLGFWLTTAEGNGPLIFGVNRSEGARLNLNEDTGNLEFLINQTATDGSGAVLQVNGDVHLTGKLTSDGGIDPPWMAYDAQTRAFVKDDADAKVKGGANYSGAVQYFNGSLRRWEYYTPSENKFYDFVTGKELTAPTPQELSKAATNRQAKKAAQLAKRQTPKSPFSKTNYPAINRQPASGTPTK